MASVVIPAHDEAEVIGATLRALLGDAGPGEFEVVVVCNGCGDDTAAEARRVPGVQVIEITTASKIAALNAGDEEVGAFPRIYLDGDTTLTTAGARALVRALEPEGIRVAGMRADVDLVGLTLPARWFHEFRVTLPVFAGGIIGAGVYALDVVARRRFDAWPDVLGDDQFVLRSFRSPERAFVADHRTSITAPTDLRTIVRRGVRVRRGNRQLTATTQLTSPPSGLRTALWSAARRPHLWPGAVTWLVTGGLIRFRTWAGARGDWRAAGARRLDRG
jgi:glycosyltransferase involved in cell wall biosynthesis